MATAKSIYQPSGWSQRNQRADAMFTDQHGRQYFGSVELKTGDVVGLMEPQFTAPIIPDQKYLERNVKNRPYDLHINYERWLADIRGARAEWEREGRQMMRKMRGAAYDPAEPFGADVLDVIGEPPEAIEPVIAAKQGNSYILGFTTRVDKRLVPFLRFEQLTPEERVAREPDFRDQIDPEVLAEVDHIEEQRLEEEAGLDFRASGEDVRVKNQRVMRRMAHNHLPEGEDPLAGIPSRKDDWDEEYVERTGQRDPDDELVDAKVARAEAQQTAPRVPVKRNRPEPRSSTKGSGRRKGHPPKGEEEKPARFRYPRGHPKAGQFMPLSA